MADIYTDPLTEKELEGEARIVTIHGVRSSVAHCEVKFRGESQAYPRQILVSTEVAEKPDKLCSKCKLKLHEDEVEYGICDDCEWDEYDFDDEDDERDDD